MKYVEIQELEKTFVEEAYFSRNLSANNTAFLFTTTAFCDIIISSAKVPVFKFSFLKKNREARVGKFHDFSIDDVIFRAENAKERCSSTASRKK